MKSAVYIALAFLTAACVPENQNSSVDRSDFAVVRDGVNIDALALSCASDPQSVGFSTTQDCFAHAQALMQSGQ